MDILKGKRYDIMNVLWEEGRPLSAFEINDIAPELKMPTVRRNYTPLLSIEDYLKGNAKSRKITPVEMMTALLETDGITEAELEQLQDLLDRKRIELKSKES